MERPLSVHEKRATKQGIIKTTKKKPVKVVYISNPMKVKASASEFRALVQELTGRDASVPGPSESGGVGGGRRHEMVADGVKEVSDGDLASDVPKGSDLTFEACDDAFMPLMLENTSGFFPSNLFYE